MDTIVQGPPSEGASVPDLNIVDTTNWTNHNQGIVNNNSTLLYIAVSKRFEFKLDE